MKRLFCLFLLLLSLTITASSHPGRTDSNGGHWDRSEGTYHYHNDGTPQNSYSSDTSDEDDLTSSSIINRGNLESDTTVTVTSDDSQETLDQEAETEDEKPKGITSRTIIIVVIIIVVGVLLFFISKWAINNYSADEFFGHLFIITIIIAGVIMLQSCDTSESYNKHLEDCDGTCTHIKDYTSEIQEAYRDEYREDIYDEAYNDIVGTYEDRTYESHVEYCDGTCDHIEKEIEHRIGDLGELCYLENVFDYYDVIKAIENAYIQGYGDCYYGNAQEYSIKEYKNKNVFDE